MLNKKTVVQSTILIIVYKWELNPLWRSIKIVFRSLTARIQSQCATSELTTVTAYHTPYLMSFIYVTAAGGP